MIKTKQVLLNDEEIQQEIGGSLEVFMGIEHNLPKILKAQLKKVVEWGDEECFKHPFTSDLKEEEYNRKRHRCPECWQSLLKELEDKP